MKSGKAWQEEETRKDTSIVLIRQEQSCTSELFKVIQDAVLLILLYRAMLLFRAASSNIFTILYVTAHKACVYSVTMHVHARARCDAHLTLHVAHVTHARCVAILAKAASAFFFCGAASQRKMAIGGVWLALSCAQWITGARTGGEPSGAHWDHRAEARDTAGGPGRYTTTGHGAAVVACKSHSCNIVDVLIVLLTRPRPSSTTLATPSQTLLTASRCSSSLLRTGFCTTQQGEIHDVVGC